MLRYYRLSSVKQKVFVLHNIVRVFRARPNKRLLTVVSDRVSLLLPVIVTITFA